MKKTINFVFLCCLFLLTGSFLLIQSGCRKSNTIENTTPKKFTDLKIDPAFKFENFSNLNLTVTIPKTKATEVNIVQVFQGDPAQGGKLIMSGALDNSGQFKSSVRVPNNVKIVYIGKLNSMGNNQFVAVPITGSSISYDFGKPGGGLKTSDAMTSTDCAAGCTETVQGTQPSSGFEINAGEIVCIAEGTCATFNKLIINPGGTLRVCGTANINSYKYGGGSGSIYVSPSGTVTLPKYQCDFDIDNYGSMNISGNGDVKTTGNIHNWGSVDIDNKFQNDGIIINDGTFTVNNSFTNGTASTFTNNCSFYVTVSGNNVFIQNGIFNNNGYVSVDGSSNLTGSGAKSTNLGLQSLFVTSSFSISGDVHGPNSQGSQIHALSFTKGSSVNGGANVTGYIDLWASSLTVNATLPVTVTKHNPGYVIPIPSCTAYSAPSITSSLQVGGLVNEPFTYLFTADGTQPITYTVTGTLPAGLTYNSTTHTISGTPTTAGVKSVTLTADNDFGNDVKTLVITITQPTAPPVINSNLTGKTTVDQPYTYLLTASGQGPITYSATNLPAGLTFNASTHQISGTPTVAGTYNISLTATNSGGTDSETLVLTVGTPPNITSALTATGTTGQQFTTYTLTATGSPTITYSMANLPSGLIWDPTNHTITGTPNNPGVTNVTMTATSTYGQSIKVLIITINEGIQPPEITSSLTAGGIVNQPFSYTITATGSDPITYNASNLPDGLTLSGNTISGIPTATGTTSVTLTASNPAGNSIKTLVITIVSGPIVDTDGDGVPDNLDKYPTDPTRAFNSYYPNEVDYGSFVFEDLWPGYGDYDCNDLVVNFQYKIVTNAQNNIVDLIVSTKITAVGASLNNGFAISLNTASVNVQSVTGCIKLGNAINIDPARGCEMGHATKTVIVPFDAVNTLLGRGMVNTIPGGATVQTQIQTVMVHFQTPQASIGTPPYNPFIFVNQERGKEVHMKDQPPTDLVNPIYFGTFDDASNPAQNLYYRSTTGLPWAFETPVSFDYPIESVDILQAYLHFADWAQSSGTSYPDWFMDNPGYRDASKIY